MTPWTSAGSVPEGRRALGGVQHAEPAAGAGSHVQQASARAEGGLDQLDGARDLVAHGADRLGHEPVLRVHHLHDSSGEARSISAVAGLLVR